MDEIRKKLFENDKEELKIKERKEIILKPNQAKCANCNRIIYKTNMKRHLSSKRCITYGLPTPAIRNIYIDKFNKYEMLYFDFLAESDDNKKHLIFKNLKNLYFYLNDFIYDSNLDENLKEKLINKLFNLDYEISQIYRNKFKSINI